MDPAQALLAQLEDIELPEAGGWQIAPGWLLLALLLAGLLYWLWVRGRKRQSRQAQPDWRKAAERELSRIRLLMNQGRDQEVIPACSRLARRIALANYPRTDIAALTGDDWLKVLDDMLGERRFSEGEGVIMASAPYRRQEDAAYHEIKAVISLLQRLLDCYRDQS